MAKTIVVIDDNRRVRRALARLLRTARYAVETFDSAEAFLGRSGCADPVCLILDVDLPGLSGPELQRTLLAAQRFIPIIFLTGRAPLPRTPEARHAGTVAVLTKPCEAHALFAAVEEALTRAGHASA